MKLSLKPKYLLFVLSLSVLPLMVGCKGSYNSRKIRQSEKMQQRQIKKTEKSYLEAVKAHEKRQSDRTLKQMRKTKRESRKLNRKKRDSFFKRLLGL